LKIIATNSVETTKASLQELYFTNQKLLVNINFKQTVDSS